MKKLKKKYQKSLFLLKLEIVKRYFEKNGIVLDPQIAETVYALQVYGFHPIMSCEGHTVSDTVDTFRNFYPYVDITLNNKIVFDLNPEDKRSYFQVINEDHSKTFRRLEQLIVEFNFVKHPFSVKNSELALVFRDDVFKPLHFKEVIEKHWNLHATVCDTGVHGIMGMPQEFLNDDFRKKFLARTQQEMEQFTKFLQWNAIENGIE